MRSPACLVSAAARVRVFSSTVVIETLGDPYGLFNDIFGLTLLLLVYMNLGLFLGLFTVD